MGPDRGVVGNMTKIGAYLINSRKENVTNPLEILAKSYMAEITTHPCEDGNGRTAVLTSMMLAQDLGLPMPLYSKADTNMIRALGEQMKPEENITPIDAMVAVAQAIDRRLTFEESLYFGEESAANPTE